MLCCAVLDEGSSRFAGSGSTSDIKIVWLASHHHTYPSGKNGTHPIIPLPSFLCEFRKTRAEIYLIELFLLRPFRRNFAPLCPLLSERSTLSVHCESCNSCEALARRSLFLIQLLGIIVGKQELLFCVSVPSLWMTSRRIFP